MEKMLSFLIDDMGQHHKPVRQMTIQKKELNLFKLFKELTRRGDRQNFRGFLWIFEKFKK
jgi:hypothetical protein